LKTYTDRKPPFLWVWKGPREVYIVLNSEEVTRYNNTSSGLRQKVRERADQVFGRSLTPKIVKICDEKGKELNVIKRAGSESKAPATPSGEKTTTGSVRPGPATTRASRPRAEAAATGSAKGKAKKTKRGTIAARLETIEFLTRDEIKRLMKVIDDKRDRALFIVAYRHGLRASEVGLLKKTDVDLKSHRIKIHRLKGSLSGVHALQSDEARMLRAYLTSRDDHFPTLFPNRFGEALTREGTRKLMGKYAERAGLPEEKRHFHVLKHSIATHLLEGGADLRIVQDRLGHATIENTVIYTHLVSAKRDERMSEAFMKLPKF